VDRAFSEAGIAPSIVVQISIALTGIMLARFGTSVALVDPQLVETMEIPGLVVRKLKPRIEAKTLLIRVKDSPRSVIFNDFVDHLHQQIGSEGS
jgi:hypothetical protein